MIKVKHAFYVILLLFVGNLNSLFCQDQNIIFIIADDLNYFDLSSPDCPVHAPNLQALAERSTSFTDAHANLPICAPSRASFLRGKYGHTTGYFGYKQNLNHWEDNPDLVPDSSIFGHFKGHGYRTISAGKVFHEGPDSIFANSIDNYNKWTHGPFVYDGTSTVNYPDNPDIGQQPYVSAGPIVEFAPADSLIWIDSTGEFEIFGDTLMDLTPDELVTQIALSELNQTQSDPFFMALGYYRPHLPFYAPEEYFELYDLDSIQIPDFLSEEVLSAAIASFNNSWASNGEELYTVLNDVSADSIWIKKFIQAYYASVSFLDDQIGDVMNALDSSAYASNTLVVFTSDHGIYLGEYGKLVNKNGLRRPSTRIPFMLSGPGIPEDSTVSHPVSCIDLYPTMAQFALNDFPEDLDGHSVLPFVNSDLGIWNGPNGVVQEITTNELRPIGEPAINDRQHYSFYNGQFRYSLFNNGEEELYELTSDPNEKLNVAYEDGFEVIKEDLRNELQNITGTQSLNFDQSNNLSYGGFEHDYSGWEIASFFNGNVASINNSDLNDKHCVLTKTTGDFTYLQNKNVFFENGNSYTLKFKAKHSLPSAALEVKLLFREDGGALTFFSDFTPTITDQWTEYVHEFDYTFESTKRKGGLRFIPQILGTLELDDIQIIDSEACHQMNFQTPVSGLEYNVIGEEISFSWNPVLNSSKCELQRNLASATIGINFSDLIPDGLDLASSPPFETLAYPLNTPLLNGGSIDHNTEYRWKVRCGCSLDPIIVSPFSDVHFFTIPDPLSVDDLNENKNSSSIYPNPNSKDELTINSNGLISVSIFTVEMKLVEKTELDASKQIQFLNISDISRGSYIIQLVHERSTEHIKFIRN